MKLKVMIEELKREYFKCSDEVCTTINLIEKIFLVETK